MGEFDLKDYVTKEFDSVWKAIDKIREDQSCLSNNFSGLSTEIRIEMGYIKKTVDDTNSNIKDLKASLDAKIESLNKAREELDKQPLKEKAKFFDMSVSTIFKTAITFILGLIAAYFGMKKG